MFLNWRTCSCFWHEIQKTGRKNWGLSSPFQPTLSTLSHCGTEPLDFPETRRTISRRGTAAQPVWPTFCSSPTLSILLRKPTASTFLHRSKPPPCFWIFCCHIKQTMGSFLFASSHKHHAQTPHGGYKRTAFLFPRGTSNGKTASQTLKPDCKLWSNLTLSSGRQSSLLHQTQEPPNKRSSNQLSRYYDLLTKDGQLA